jgi:hypothetical protein
MKRLIIAAFVLGISLKLGQTAEAATAYNFFDLSAGISHKSGTIYDGMWNDGLNWVATNGADAVFVDGRTFETKNISPALRYLGVGQVVSAAGDGSRIWLIAGTPGANEYLTLTPSYKNLVFAELTPTGNRRADLSTSIPAGYSSVVLFGVNGNIFVLFPSQSTLPARLYKYVDGSLTEVALPNSAQNLPSYSYTYDHGHLIGFWIDNGVAKWISFDGRNWDEAGIPETMGYEDALRYIRARGLLIRGWIDESYVKYAYPLQNARDHFNIASRRPDGTTLLGGYGTNGLRLVLLSPINNPYADEDEIGNIQLTATAVKGTTSKYVLRAEAQSDVTFIRLLKNGIGITKCSGRVCTATVDVKGTADRFEAYGQWRNGELGRPVTSRAVVLRDTAAIQEIRPWHGAYGFAEAKSTIQPNSLNPTELEKTAWHLDFSHTLVLSGNLQTQIIDGKPIYSYPSDLKTLTQAAADWNKAKAEIFVEGQRAAVCRPDESADSQLAYWKALSQKAQYISATMTIRHCVASFDKKDVPDAKYTGGGYRYGAYWQYPSPAQIRVYAKISWKEKGRTIMTISPTDTITYQ